MFRFLGICQAFFLLVVIPVFYFAYQSWWRTSTALDEFRRSMAKEVCHQASLDIPLPPGRPVVAVAEIKGDFRGMVTEEMRDALAQRNAMIVEVGPWDAWLPTRIRPNWEYSIERATASAKSWNIPYVVFCEIKDWVLLPAEEATLTVEVTLIDVNQNTILFKDEFSMCSEGPSLIVDAAIANRFDLKTKNASTEAVILQGHGKSSNVDKLFWFATWFLICGSAPWLEIKVISHAINSNSNVASIIALMGYLVVVIAASMYMWGLFESTWLAGMGILIMIFGWMIYFEVVCRTIAKRGRK